MSGSAQDKREADEAAITKMATGLSSEVEDSTERLSKLLLELVARQEEILAALRQENDAFGTGDEGINRVHSTMLRTQQYYKKALALKKSMHELHGRAAKLKARASRIEAQESSKLQTRIARDEHEKRIAARPAKQ